MTQRKTDKYIVKARPAGDVVYHSKEGAEKRFCYLSGELVPEAGIYIGAVNVGDEPEEETIDFHIHDVAQIYCLLGKVTTEVILEDEMHVVSAPATIFIPAGMRHRVLRNYGRGTLVIVLQKPAYG